MDGLQEIGFWACLTIAMGLAVVALLLKKPGEYINGPRLLPLFVVMSVFLALSIALALLE
jgi:hypothetical protein